MYVQYISTYMYFGMSRYFIAKLAIITGEFSIMTHFYNFSFSLTYLFRKNNFFNMQE